ncbi:hypothetical protein [Segatella copri]|uniref:Uncharacterized protein n=1 Tax=Segatella copri TaxID=165179 RepID=A0AA92WHD1_9BACT|nr:hypothetical protein [Segatella copri]RHA83101.1 hypothetical protein DW916_13350 [Segatella copri]
MANVNNYQKFSEIDYCIRQYFSKYMASTISQEQAKLKDGQTVDYMMKQCKKRWNKDGKLNHDTKTFVNAFHRNLVALYGNKQSAQLLAYAKAYVNSRYESLTVEHLARKKVPHSSAEYIAKKMFSESLIGFGADLASKKDDLGDKVKEKAEELYKPSALEVGTGYVGAAAIDTAITGGVGGIATAATKGAAVASAKMAASITAKNVSKTMATDLAIRGAIYGAGKGIDAYLDEDNYGSLVFGDKDAVKKIQGGSYRYKKGGTEYINSLNGQLNKKIKTPSLSTSSTIKKESNALLVANKGNSTKLLNTISSNLSKQCISFKENSKIPGWMLNNSVKKNRALASSFYACAMEMSKKQQHERMFGGKKMTIQQVSQRAYDYARAADYLDKHTPHRSRKAASAKGKDQWDVEMEKLNASINGTVPVKKHRHSSSPTPTRSSSSSTRLPYAQQSTPASSQTIQTQQAQSTQKISQTGNNRQQFAGWGNTLEQMGLNDFSIVSKNLGYALAMLPDMLIGMFTGKNPNMKMQDNLMPLAAIVGGMFIRNPLIKMLLIGFGGVNILNNAGHASLKEGLSRSSSASKMYKKYEDEKLNPRITDVTMKGGSMIATIDGSPCVINISNSAADAYQKGVIPLNTLANAVLKKYDENQSLASHKYEQINRQENSVPQQIGIK